MSSDTNVFSLNTSDPEGAWLHGRTMARAWFTGSLRADEQLDLSAEFDAKVSAQVGAGVAQALASLSAEFTGSAHAGLRLQVAAPMDLFVGAGLLARARMEASVTAQLQVIAALSLGALQQKVMDEVPIESRDYVRIFLEEANIRAGIWARGAFAAMAVAELVATASLFPTDDSEPGITAYLHYGYAWGFGGGWGTVVNVGFKPDRLFDRLSQQLSSDISARLQAFRTEVELRAEDALSSLTEIGEALLPEIFKLLLKFGFRIAAGNDAGRRSEELRAECVAALRRSLTTALIPRLAQVCAAKLPAIDVSRLDVSAYRSLWARANIAMAQLGDSDTTSLDALLAAGALIIENAGLLPVGVRAQVVNSLRCAVALVLLLEKGGEVDIGKLEALFGRRGDGLDPTHVASAVLREELGKLAAQLPVVPQWISQLVGGINELVSILGGGQGTGTGMKEAAAFAKLLQSLANDFLQTPAWTAVLSALPTSTGTALTAATKLLTKLCVELTTGVDPDLGEFREGLSACVLTFLSDPVSRVLTIVADRGLRQIPTALRDLAAQVDQGNTPVDLNSSWEQLGRETVGVSVGLPLSIILEKTAATAENWCDTVLPGELSFLQRSIQLQPVCEKIIAVGARKAIAAYRTDFLSALGQHCLQHIGDSIAFAVRESKELFPALISSAVESITRTVTLLAVASFKALEESITIAERVGIDLQQRITELERQLASGIAHFLDTLRSIASTIGQLSDRLGDEIVNWVTDQAVSQASTTGLSRDILRGIVSAAVNTLSGGLIGAVGATARALGDSLSVGAQAFLAAAESQRQTVGVQELARQFWNTGSLPPIEIPIVIEIPNPFLPFILPNIKQEIARVTLPAEVVGSAALTLLMDGLGVGPLLAGLDVTVRTLGLTRIALAQVRSLLSGNTAAQQREIFQKAQAVGALSVEVVSPAPDTVAGERGQIRFLIHGANLSFVFPQAAGLPALTPARVRVLVNGEDLTLTRVQWTESGDHVLEGALGYASSSLAAQGADVLVRTPVVVIVAVTDGQGASEAHAAWQFVTERTGRRPSQQVQIDATALTLKEFNVRDSTGALSRNLSKSTVQSLTLPSGAYLFGTFWNPVFEFSVTPAGTVRYALGLTFLSGAGTTVLRVRGVWIQVDATALSLPEFHVRDSDSSNGVTLSKGTVKTLALLPGAYVFGTFWNPVFKFSVTPAGTVEYAPELTFLSGAGTALLEVRGMKILVDATALSLPEFHVHDSVSSDGVTLSKGLPQTLTLIPGTYLFGTFWDSAFKFSVTPAGTVEYAPELAFLSGNGTDMLEVHGVRIQVDATALSLPEFHVRDSASSNGVTLSKGSVQTLTLIPGTYLFGTYWNSVFKFSVTPAGTVEYAPELAFLSGTGTAVLEVRGVKIQVDATALTAEFQVRDSASSLTKNLSAGVIHELTLIPGLYRLITVDGPVFEFSVSGTGTVEYSPGLPLVSGAGSSVLTVLTEVTHVNG